MIYKNKKSEVVAEGGGAGGIFQNNLSKFCSNFTTMKMVSVSKLQQIEKSNSYLVLSTLKTDLLPEDKNRRQCELVLSFVIMLAKRRIWYMFTAFVQNLSRIIQFLWNNIARWKLHHFS